MKIGRQSANSAQKWALRGFAITFVAVLGRITTGLLG